MKRMTLFMSAALALGLSACSSDDTITEVSQVNKYQLACL